MSYQLMKGSRLNAQDGAARLPLSALQIVLVFALIGGVLLALGHRYFNDLHSVLDTSIFLLSGVAALLLWDIASRMPQPLFKWVAISLAITSLLECGHTLMGLDWSGPFASITASAKVLRPTTWPPAAYILPIGICCSLWFIPKEGHCTLIFTAALVLLGIVFHPLFYWVPQYSPPVWFGITRPTLILVPLLWAAIAWVCWQRRATDRLFPMLALMAVVLFIGNLSMLYSTSPHDTEAMVAHLGKIGGYLGLLLSLMHMLSADMLERIRAEQKLARLNEELEGRVLDRTASLEAEIAVRRQAEHKVGIQVQRLNLLHHITRAIGERQDLASIYQVAIRSLEDNLPIDFGCICRYEPSEQMLIVTCVGMRSGALARELAMTELARVPIDQNGLSRCVKGQLVYEPNIVGLSFPFPHRLASGGLCALVAAPLLAESKVFGVLIAARSQLDSFSSSDCEFLKQLSEHVALAAHQAQLYSALQQAYDDLRQSQQAVMQQERLRALGQMASGVAHDINNAISPVALYAESLLELEPTLSERARQYLTTIRRAIDDVAHTISRMRQFYRPHEPERTLSRVNLNRIVEQVIELTRVRWRDLPQEHGVVIDCRTELNAGLPDVMGAESEMRDALTNLVFNAVDAMPTGGALTIRTQLLRRNGNGHDAGDVVRIEVQDTGTGMDEETRRRCLEPFFSTKGERGTGLGLAMVYGMVQRHSAEIEIVSAPGEGTMLRLTFPVAVITNVGTQPISTLRPKRPLRILIVDDDPLIIESLRNTLGTDHHHVTTADGGQAGIATFVAAAQKGESFAVVITDLGMPYVDGRKVAAAVKAASPATPVILLTGWGQRLMDEHDVPPHVDRVLNKPPKLHELRHALAELVND